MTETEIRSNCATCKGRAYAEANPDTLLARLWRWHTGWCPGWKAYQRELKNLEAKKQAAQARATP
jgi:hypothetical protein